MGFIVEKQVDFPGGINLDSFYVRIESYVLNRSVGQLDILVGHYTNEKGVRKLKETLDNIISKINLIRITISDDKNLIFELKSLKSLKSITFPIKITQELVNELVIKQDNIPYDVKMMYL